MKKKKLNIGIDVGSTTVKTAVMDPDDYLLLYSEYVRHNADQAGTVCDMLKRIADKFPDTLFSAAACGSGGQTIADTLGICFIQEVVANSLIIRKFYHDVRVAIELGGQDAKVVFFRYDTASRQLVPSDMRMNGSCAGGTGAFIDQIAELLNIKTEEIGALAAGGTTVYDISGRCGVFAKTDIQPLLNQGISKSDIALSSFHAIAKQTIGGLAQGMEIKPKVIFEGGPLTFNPCLIKVFQERLSLSDNEIIIPDNPELIVAKGAALSVDTMFADYNTVFSPLEGVAKLENRISNISFSPLDNDNPFFDNDESYKDFMERHKDRSFEYFADTKDLFGIRQSESDESELDKALFNNNESGSKEAGLSKNNSLKELDVYLGIDAGSTTSKFILINRENRIVDTFYSGNRGEPLKVIQYALLRMRDRYREKGIELNILGTGTTGYGELLFAKAFSADYHTVETVAHAEAARFFVPDVSFILDIGGQDMKAINLNKGVVTGIVLNEACSAGCGSFVETYAKSLNVPVEKIAEYAFKSSSPSRLGSRCTVFMNSSIITEQKNGKTTEDILAGISRSIIENVFTKVVRISNFNDLGNKIVVQGGTFKNDAVLRAFEQYTGREVVRAPFPGEMGAFGIAILAKKYIEEKISETGSFQSSFIGLDAVESFTYSKSPGVICPFCSNSCSRTVIEFSHGGSYITGNRCEKGQILGEIKNPKIREKLQETRKKQNSVPDMFKLHNEILYKKENYPLLTEKRKITIGIPVTLEFWNSLPFWKAVFLSLGFNVVLSGKSSYDIFEKGLKYVPSDTVCFPAKLLHGHVEELAEKKVDRIFNPLMIRIPKENSSACGNHTCVMLQGYPMVVEKSNEIYKRCGIKFDHPIFHWYNEKLKSKQVSDWLFETFSIERKTALKALDAGNLALKNFKSLMESEGQKIIKSLEGTDKFAVILAGRPYHSDLLVNHNLSNYFTSQGIPVLSLDSLEAVYKENVDNVRMETTITFHTRMAAAAIAAANHPNLEIVQIVSFGCGHDAVISDEMVRELKNRSDKELLVLKLDEGESAGPLNIRVKSFIETVTARRKQKLFATSDTKKEKKILYTKKDRKKKTILAPNLSPAFTELLSAIINKSGIKMEPLPLAGERAVELGKKYVHNDICYPAQVNIGEMLAILEKGEYEPSCVALGLAKNCEACRAGQYAALARKALDDAGYPEVPVVTTGLDTKKLHPGFKLSVYHQLQSLWGITIIDACEMMLRRIRPYEKVKGSADAVFERNLKKLCGGISLNTRKLMRLLSEAIEDFNKVEITQMPRKPRVGIVGEILMNYHPSANCYIEKYLEENGLEVVQPAMHDFFRKTAVIEKELGKRKMTPFWFFHYIIHTATDYVYEHVHKKIWNKISKEFRFKTDHENIYRIVENIEPFIDRTYVGAEGWKLPGEIMSMIQEGVKSFVILQPFGCLPNHITGRGMIKTVKQIYPDVQIIAIDYDPDTSLGNVENRLQMLILNAKELESAKDEEPPLVSGK